METEYHVLYCFVLVGQGARSQVNVVAEGLGKNVVEMESDAQQKKSSQKEMVERQ